MPPILDPFDPLGESADPRRYVPLASSERILADIAARMREGCSPILLAGPSGVGKTLLLRVLGERERLSGRRVVYSPFFNLAPDECARWLLHLLGIPLPRGSPAEPAFLADLRSPGRPPTLVLVDEIQEAPEASVRKLAELAQAGRPVLAVVAAGSQGRPLQRRLPELAPEATLLFPESLPEAEVGALCGAILSRPELPPHLRQALLPARREIVSAASGLPRLLKTELEVRAQNFAALQRPRRRAVEELRLDTWTPPAAAPSREPAPEHVRRAPPLDTRKAPAPPAPALARKPTPPAAAPSRGQAPQLPRSAPPRPASRETIGAWAALAAREAHRARERLTESTLRAGRVARAHREVAFARASGAARQIRVAARSARRRAASALGEAGATLAAARRMALPVARRGAASVLGEAGATLAAARRMALPAAALCALALLMASGLGTGTHEISAPVYRTAAAQLAPFPPPEATPLPSPAAERATSLPVQVQVQAQVNARPWARIRIDGVDVGPTPLSRPLAPGVYRIEAEFPDGRSLERHVEIGPEQRFVALP